MSFDSADFKCRGLDDITLPAGSTVAIVDDLGNEPTMIKIKKNETLQDIMKRMDRHFKKR